MHTSTKHTSKSGLNPGFSLTLCAHFRQLRSQPVFSVARFNTQPASKAAKNDEDRIKPRHPALCTVAATASWTTRYTFGPDSLDVDASLSNQRHTYTPLATSTFCSQTQL